MKNSWAKAIFFFTWITVSLSSSASEFTGIEGKWKTIDDESGKEKSVIEIIKKGDLYEGIVLKLFKEPHEEQNPLCDQCQGELRNRPLIGLKVLSNLKKRNSDWGDGDILDPNNGKTYDVKMELVDSGKTLKVRGFLGFSFLGRTQKWHRIE